MNKEMLTSIQQLKIEMDDIRKKYNKEQTKWRFYQRYHILR